MSRLLFVLATGGGKTIVASHLVSCALEQGSHVLFVAHRQELIRQAFCKLVRNGIPVPDVGVIMGDTPADKGGELFPGALAETLEESEIWRRFGRRRPAARVQVASIDTLRVRAKLERVDLIIIDEAHRALAPSYKALVAAHPEAVVLGLTATPYRADGKGLDDLFDELVVIATPSLLIAEGFLVEPEVWTVPIRPDLSGVKMKGRDYDPTALASAVDRAELVGDIVDHWKQHAAGIRTVAFACSVEHSRNIARRFVEAGVAAEHLDGKTADVERLAILQRLERGETLVVSNCGVLCEGWDQPAVKCAILARPTKSTGLVMQQAGRILRPWNGQRAVILDHAGCMLEHGLPQDDREFTLKGDSKKAKNAGGGRECPDCHRVVANGVRICPGCGAELAEAQGGTDVAEVDGKLVKVAATQLERDLMLLAAIETQWREKNAKRSAPMKPGWIAHEFKKKAGRWPPKSYALPTLSGEELAARAKLERLLAESVAKGQSPGVAHMRLERETKTLENKEMRHVAPKAEPAATPPPPAPPVTSGFVEPWDRPRRAPAKAPTPKQDVELEEVAF